MGLSPSCADGQLMLRPRVDRLWAAYDTAMGTIKRHVRDPKWCLRFKIAVSNEENEDIGTSSLSAQFKTIYHWLVPTHVIFDARVRTHFAFRPVGGHNEVMHFTIASSVFFRHIFRKPGDIAKIT